MVLLMKALYVPRQQADNRIHFFHGEPLAADPLIGFRSSSLAWMCCTEIKERVIRSKAGAGGKIFARTWTIKLMATKLSEPLGMITSAYFFDCVQETDGKRKSLKAAVLGQGRYRRDKFLK